GIEGDVWAVLGKANAFVRLAVTDPTGVAVVVGEVSAGIGEPVAAPEEGGPRLRLGQSAALRNRLTPHPGPLPVEGRGRRPRRRAEETLAWADRFEAVNADLI